jgi:dynein heavy chain
MDMEQKLAPGMFVLTWTSMNIDGYLHRWVGHHLR